MQWWCAATGVPWTWSWTAYPGVWIFVAAVAVAFSRLQARFATEEDGRRAVWFFVGLVFVWAALDWPIGALAAGYLSSMKMVQYLLLSLIASPLILIGMPRAAYRSLLSSRVAPLIRLTSHPLVAIAIFVTIMAWTHWAPVVDALMVSQLGSFFMDMIWIAAGLIFWWPVCAPLPERSWLTDPARVGYLIAATLVNTGVFAYLTFTELPLYAVYELAPPVSGLSTRDDQRLAGLLMKIGGALILWTAITILFFRWANREVTREGRDRASTAGLVLLCLLGLTACGAGETGDAGSAEGDAERAVPVDGGSDTRELAIETAVIGRPLTPGRAALYLIVANGTTADRSLVAVEVDGVPHASMHETTMTAGSMAMRPVESVPVPASGRVEMRPGGLHVMLEDAPDGRFDDAAIDVVVRFDDGTALTASARIVPLADLESALGG